VKAVQLPETAWQSVLEAMGMPGDRTGLYIEMVKSFNSGWIHFGDTESAGLNRHVVGDAAGLPDGMFQADS